MKDSLSSLELYYIVKEMQILLGARIDKVYQPEKTDILLQLYSAKIKKQYLRVLVPKVMYLSKNKPEMTEPGQFCMLLRKHLQMGYIDAVRQIGAERIVEIVVKKLDKSYTLIVELFGKGNLALTTDKIIGVLFAQRFKDRTIRGGIEYEYPPLNQDIKTIAKADFSVGDNPEKDLASTYALGKHYAKEVMATTKGDLLKTAKAMFERELSPRVVNGEILPFELEAFEEGQEYATFSEAIDSVYTEISAVKKKVSPSEIKKKKKLNILKAQKKSLENVQIKIGEAKEKGDQIYEKYQEITAVLTKIKDLQKDNEWNTIRSEIMKEPSVTEFDLKTKNITFTF